MATPTRPCPYCGAAVLMNAPACGTCGRPMPPMQAGAPGGAAREDDVRLRGADDPQASGRPAHAGQPGQPAPRGFAPPQQQGFGQPPQQPGYPPPAAAADSRHRTASRQARRRPNRRSRSGFGQPPAPHGQPSGQPPQPQGFGQPPAAGLRSAAGPASRSRRASVSRRRRRASVSRRSRTVSLRASRRSRRASASRRSRTVSRAAAGLRSAAAAGSRMASRRASRVIRRRSSREASVSRRSPATRRRRRRYGAPQRRTARCRSTTSRAAAAVGAGHDLRLPGRAPARPGAPEEDPVPRWRRADRLDRRAVPPQPDVLLVVDGRAEVRVHDLADHRRRGVPARRRGARRHAREGAAGRAAMDPVRRRLRRRVHLEDGLRLHDDGRRRGHGWRQVGLYIIGYSTLVFGLLARIAQPQDQTARIIIAVGAGCLIPTFFDAFGFAFKFGGHAGALHHPQPAVARRPRGRRVLHPVRGAAEEAAACAPGDRCPRPAVRGGPDRLAPAAAGAAVPRRHRSTSAVASARSSAWPTACCRSSRTSAC